VSQSKRNETAQCTRFNDDFSTD